MVTKKRLVVLVIVALVSYGLLSRFGSFSDSVQALRQADFRWMIMALAATLISYILASAVYLCLARKPLAVWPTILIQLAGNFANRLLPAGSGALAINYRYLRQQQHTAPQASAVLLLNNAIGFIANLLVLAITVLTSAVTTATVRPPQYWWVVLLAIIAAAAIGWTVVNRIKRIARAVRKLLLALAAYRERPGRLIRALLFAAALAVSYALCLLACTRAVSLDLSFAAVFISMSLGVLGATVTPTPGGLGGAEAALLGALVLYGADKPAALAAILLYRICTFWLPLLFGGPTLVFARKKRYV